ncbi:uncharacterized protein [Setaria viridis]|uniref:uncharacterized protein isoform X3 n=1 Tax=Setaria viridis TaxID=4556 RepID=UPI003B3B6A1E
MSFLWQKRSGSTKFLMAEMVGSAVVQEGMSRAFSFMLGKHLEKASEGHSAERLEMALSELEFALERTAKLPITEASLLRRRKLLKRGYVEGIDLLNKHKLQGHQERPGVKRKRWITCSKNLSISSFGGLNTDGVRRFEWFADCAGKFVRDVESGCSLRHHTFCNPLVRHLLNGKALKYEMVQGSQVREFFIRPAFLGERGVEASLHFQYMDRSMPEKSFRLLLWLRVSESTDLVAIAIRCTESLTFLSKPAAESAIAELTLLPNVLDSAYAMPWVGNNELYVLITKLSRQDPVCCTADGQGSSNIMLSELSQIFPEQVIAFRFESLISAPKYCSSCSSDGLCCTKVQPPTLLLSASFWPHTELMIEATEFRRGSLEETSNMARKVAMECLISQKELKEHTVRWASKHGAALFCVKSVPHTASVRCPIPEELPREKAIEGGGSEAIALRIQKCPTRGKT